MPSDDGKNDSEPDAAPQVCELSIVICTHNRPNGVEELISILQPQIAGHAVELIVVDSASNVEAATRLREMTIATPQSKLIRLDSAGVSAARNAGLHAAKAAWIAYIDDDEIPPADWVFQLRQLTGRLPLDCAACGGNFLPVFPTGTTCKPSPRWLEYLGKVNQQGEFDQTAAPNFLHQLFRVSALQEIGGFDLRLGRDDSTLMCGEEVLLLRQLIAKGWKVWHSDRISLGHRIPADRLKREWVRKRAFWQGVTEVRLLSIQSPDELRRLAFQTAMRKPVLFAAALIFRDFLDFDIRLAFRQGVDTALSNLSAAEP